MPEPVAARTRPLRTASPLAFLAPLVLLSLGGGPARGAGEGSAPPVLKAMEAELDRSVRSLKVKDQPKPYFFGFWMTEFEGDTVAGKIGAITRDDESRSAYASAEVRVGNYDFDDTYPEDPQRVVSSDSFRDFDWTANVAPVDGSPLGIRSVFWRLADATYKAAAEAYFKKKAFILTQVEKESLPDFSREEPAVYYGRPVTVSLDHPRWRDQIREVTDYLARRPHVLGSDMSVEAAGRTDYYVTNEGTRIVQPRSSYRIYLRAYTRGEDGLRIEDFRRFVVGGPGDLPTRTALMDTAKDLGEELEALRSAPVLKPYTGPAILDGDVAGVFFHEALGHRLEGERQRNEESGDTFKGKVGEKILPEFLTVVDDPTLQGYAGQWVAGSYRYDEQGVPSQRVVLVKAGTLSNYLMSRTPVKGFLKSNGHGRSQGPGSPPVGRMGNLIVESTKKVSFEDLKKMLMEEARRQGKPYGLIIRRTEGGETNTRQGGGSVQSLRDHPVVVLTVDAQTGKETLVRGVEVVGTPLTSLEQVIATGSDPVVFNGFCGAESGMVPVSTVSPAILSKEVELQKAQGDPRKPPILPPPWE